MSGARPRLTATPKMRVAAGLPPTPAVVKSANLPIVPPPAPMAAPAPAAPAGPTKRERRRLALRRTRKLLEERYPFVFSWARPLAVGMFEQIRGAIDEAELSKAELHNFLRWWIALPPYQAAIARGDRRINLDGSDAGPAMIHAPNNHAQDVV